MPSQKLISLPIRGSGYYASTIHTLRIERMHIHVSWIEQLVTVHTTNIERFHTQRDMQTYILLG